jgi:hypothetical protein
MLYSAINVEGGLFPAELLDDIAAGTATLPEASALAGDGRRLTDDIQSAFSDARSYWDAFQRRLGRSNMNPTTLTRQDWMLKFLELIGFGPLAFQRAALEAGGQHYNISHRAGDFADAPPIHIVSIYQELDAREETGRRISPHGLVQEYLNRSGALWGMVGNGNVLRLLRDTARLSRPTYLEFNLQGMMQGNQYSEFALLYRLIHSSHFPRQDANPQHCGLERYYQDGLEQGGRVRDKLRNGVEECLKILGSALLQHPDSEALRQKLANGELDIAGYYRQLLRAVYRLLFLMVAEERSLIFPEEATASLERRVYRDYYSVGKLRDRAEGYFRGDVHSDLWLGLRETFRLFRDSDTAGKLGVSALDAELFGPDACRDLEEAHCRNEQLLAAVRQLSTFLDDGRERPGRTRRTRVASVRRRVNYEHLNVEELGSIYESLLDFHPRLSLAPPSFELVSGSERKETGSYYTPPELVTELINSALVPVIEDRLKGLDSREAKESALLAIKVCDPACGSGHFLLAAARRIGRELELVRTGGQEPDTSEHRVALRDVIRQCIYAVDRNPLAVDLCKVALWIEGHHSGLPLSFLDHHVRCGDSLVGVFDLEVLEQGIPDGAYKPVTGDDRTAARAYTQKNRRERAGQFSLGAGVMGTHAALAGEFKALAELVELTPADVQSKASRYVSLRDKGSPWWDRKVACDLWTSAFFLPMIQGTSALLEGVPTTGTVRQYMTRPTASTASVVERSVETSQKQRFFHWPLEFPEVFENGGFDVVLGNPPWEQMQPEEVKFFGVYDQDIAALVGAQRKRAIERLPQSNPSLAFLWEAHKRDIETTGKFARGSCRFNKSAVGKLNTYPLFAEHFRRLMNAGGRAGVIVPSGIATDDTTKVLFGDLVEKGALVSLYDFENRDALFPGVHRSYKFCLLTLTGEGHRQDAGEFAFFLHRAEQLREDERRFQLTGDDFALLNPNTRTCPIFRTRRDMEITRGIYQRVPVLMDDSRGDQGNPWRIQFRQGLFNMTSDSSLFRTREQLEGQGWALNGNVFRRGRERYLPLYEAKLVHQFDHRWATYRNDGDTRDLSSQEKNNPQQFALPRYWVPKQGVQERLEGKWDRNWLLGWRDITNSTNERTVIASMVPRVGVGNNMPLMMSPEKHAEKLGLLASSLSSYVLDFISRSKAGGTHLNFFVISQLSVLGPEQYDENTPWNTTKRIKLWMNSRILELTYTAWDLQPFAQDLGYNGPPFRWDENRRFLLRCELDAAFFLLYGIARDDVDYIMGTFPIVKRKDDQAHGEYRTRRVILEIYDEMARAILTDRPYQTRLDPPPADPRAAHQAATRGVL